MGIIEMNIYTFYFHTPFHMVVVRVPHLINHCKKRYKWKENLDIPKVPKIIYKNNLLCMDVEISEDDALS